MTARAGSGDRLRVAVTGFGVKTPAGNDVDRLWATLLEGRSVARPFSRVEGSGLPVQFGCEVPPFELVPFVAVTVARRSARGPGGGLGGARDAGADAGLSGGGVGVDPSRCGVVAGTGVGGLSTLVEQQTIYAERGPERVSPFFVPMMMPNAVAAHVGMHLGWTGPNLCVATACAAGAHSIGEAVRLLRAGIVDVVVAGGAEAPLVPVAVAAFWRMGALSQRHSDPSRASRPFDADRDGFVMGEGSGFVVLEPWDAAVARGARIRGEVLGYGANSDAHHVTAPSPGGAGAAACMEAALRDAGLDPSEIGHVNAHGTSTPLNDAAEAEAIGKVFGGSPPPVTSGKGVTGHLVGAAGAVEAISALLAAKHGVVPPTANHERTDPGIDLDIVAGCPRDVAPAPVLSNSFGFGGHNAALVLAPA